MLELTDTNNTAYLFLSAANRWLEVRTVRRPTSRCRWTKSASLWDSTFITALSCAGLSGGFDRTRGSSRLHKEFTQWSSLQEPGGLRTHVRPHGEISVPVICYLHALWLTPTQYGSYLPLSCRLATTWTGLWGTWRIWRCRWQPWRRSTASSAPSRRTTTDQWVKVTAAAQPVGNVKFLLQCGVAWIHWATLDSSDTPKLFRHGNQAKLLWSSRGASLHHKLALTGPLESNLMILWEFILKRFNFGAFFSCISPDITCRWDYQRLTQSK